ncbi:hypothetical protein T06_9106 [Trichinella sp. T6]|nr:hypothetical protein T06_9106 [Trichinella sp. T6]
MAEQVIEPRMQQDFVEILATQALSGMDPIS